MPVKSDRPTKARTALHGAARALRGPLPLTPLVLAFGAISSAALAMDEDIGIECEECRYPTAVRISGHCSGVYAGDRLVITAAHCLSQITEGASKVYFGENASTASKAAYGFVIEHCAAHPDGRSDTNAFGERIWYGPDIAYCVLEEDVTESLYAIPAIPPFIPNGYERDWLAERVYESGSKPLVTVVGSGCERGAVSAGEDCHDGIKRFAGRQLERQTTYAGSATKLQLHRELWGDFDTGLRSGDSGGPVFIKMPAPDNTWRLLGVNSFTAIDDYAEAVPPYLRWIEADSGIDITPHHNYLNGSWVVDPEHPTAVLPKYEHDAYWGDWYYHCSVAPRGYSESYTMLPFEDEGTGGDLGYLDGGTYSPPGDKAVPSPETGQLTVSPSRSDTRPLVFDGGKVSVASPLPFLPLETEDSPVLDLLAKVP